MYKNRNSNTLIVTVLLLILAMTACNSGGADAENWLFEDQGYFYTNDIAKAQEKLPFTIVIPDYLPDNMPVKPISISGRLRESWPENELKVEFAYEYVVNGTLEGLVHISELNQTPLELSSGYGSDDETMQINGTEVVQQDDSLPRRGSDIPDIEGFFFWWGQNDTFMNVGVFGYSHDEALEVIESMINHV